MDLTTTTGYVPGFCDELNLRELGGLPTTDGRHVRRGLFFRGSALVGLSEAEWSLLDGMGIRYLLDLRAQGETIGREDQVPCGACYERIGGMRFSDGSEVDFSPGAIERFERENPGALANGNFMVDLYVSMAFGNAAVHALVDHVREGDVPVYFHCTAGKDRTGVCALVLCLILGVTRDAIMQDFLLTNEYRRSFIEGAAKHLPPDTPPEVIEMRQKANGVDGRHLEAVFDAIAERNGSVEAYLADEFGLGESELRALRDRYLMP